MPLRPILDSDGHNHGAPQNPGIHRVKPDPSTEVRPTAAGGDADEHRQELDSETLVRLRDLDPDALAAFYEAYFDRLYGYVRRMVGEDHLAEDVTQDIFMHIHKSLPSYDPERALRPWVFTIATNKVRDFWRSRRHRDTLRETSYDEPDMPPVGASQEPIPDRVLENKELGTMLGSAIERLPEGMRTTLMLRYFEGLSFEAIGEIVDRNEAAVRKRYSRALEELRRELGQMPDLQGRGEA